MKKRMKKAAVIAALGYCSVVGLGLGMLKAAQQTRRTLYGGKPVLAQLDRTVPARYALALGGGEWYLSFSMPDLSAAVQAAELLPPSAGKCFLRFFLLTDRAADYTAGCITDA